MERRSQGGDLEGSRRREEKRAVHKEKEAQHNKQGEKTEKRSPGGDLEGSRRREEKRAANKEKKA